MWSHDMAGKHPIEHVAGNTHAYLEHNGRLLPGYNMAVLGISPHASYLHHRTATWCHALLGGRSTQQQCGPTADGQTTSNTPKEAAAPGAASCRHTATSCVVLLGPAIISCSAARARNDSMVCCSAGRRLTRMRLVAVHFSPLETGQPACTL